MRTRQKVACLLGADFEDTEFHVPHEHLISAGYTVDVISPEAGQKLTGYHKRVHAVADFSIDDVDVDDYAALLIPGGFSPDHLRADERFVEFVRDFDATGRPIAAICHGPQLLMSAGLVQGRTLTAYVTVRSDLGQMGARVRDQAVVRDRNWITSRTPEDVAPFTEALLESLQGDTEPAGHSVAEATARQ